MTLTRRTLLAAAAALTLVPAAARAEWYTPARGSEERAAIMDAARVPIGGAIGLPVIFVVDVLNVERTWGYLQARPVNPDGSPIDWSRTRLARDWQAGVMSDIAMVLLRRDGRGSWEVVDWVMGPTDVFWIEWMMDYGLPDRFFMD